MKSFHNFMDIMRYRTIMFNDSLLILLSQFVAIPEKAFWVSFSKEKQSENLQSGFYQRLTLNTKKSDTCHCDFDHNLVPTILGAISTHNVHFTGKRLSWHPETIYIIILHGDMKSAFLIIFLLQNLITSDNPISIWLWWT